VLTVDHRPAHEQTVQRGADEHVDQGLALSGHARREQPVAQRVAGERPRIGERLIDDRHRPVGPMRVDSVLEQTRLDGCPHRRCGERLQQRVVLAGDEQPSCDRDGPVGPGPECRSGESLGHEPAAQQYRWGVARHVPCCA
jgi:hypothetical protein